MSPDVVTPDTANVEEGQSAAAPVPPPTATNTNAHPEVALVTPPPADANTQQPIAPVPLPPQLRCNRWCFVVRHLGGRMIPVSRY
jgi:hypothetical protein